jgi:hypothetical protein
MRLENAVFIFMILCVAVVFIAALVGFILVQIKARLFWRLSSLVLVLVGSCWFCSFYTHLKIVTQYGEYMRGVNSFVWGVDQLTLQGRTNEVRQVCGDFSECFWTPHDTTNFDRVVARTLDLANQQPNTPPETTGGGAFRLTTTNGFATPQAVDGSVPSH